jgi:hypothetical protein
MNGELLQRVEKKLDLIIELLHDKTLTSEEIALIKETDECVKHGRFNDLTRL